MAVQIWLATCGNGARIGMLRTSIKSAVNQDASNPQGPETGDKRVVRGGAWSDHRHDARCASRGRRVPDYFYNDLGFRVVLSPIKPLDS